MRLRYLVFFEYLGHGFQGGSVRQSKIQTTVQQTLENALNRLFMDASCSNVESDDVTCFIPTHFSSRTDIGVHALRNALHVDLDRGDVNMKKSFSPKTLVHAWNGYLCSQSTQLLSSYIVPDDFNARYNAIDRHYLYRIHCYSGLPSLHDQTRSWMISKDLNEDLMRQAAYILLGEHDFTSFRGSSCQAKSPIRSINVLDVRLVPSSSSLHSNSKVIQITCKARSFLYHQVRNIVGTLVAVGSHLITIDDVYHILKSKDRRLAPDTAPAQGLYLQNVIYPSSVFEEAKYLESELKARGCMDLRENPW